MVAGLDAEKVERYFKSLLGKDIALLGLSHLGKPPDGALGKSYGYGSPSASTIEGPTASIAAPYCTLGAPARSVTNI